MSLLAQIGLAWLAGIALGPWLNLPWQAILVLSLPGIAALLLYRDQLHLNPGLHSAVAADLHLDILGLNQMGANQGAELLPGGSSRFFGCSDQEPGTDSSHSQYDKDKQNL